jgi:hypothetical protein
MSITFSNGYQIVRTLSTASLVTSGLQFNLQTAPSSGTTWTDASGNGYNAIISGSTSYVSNNGGGIKLNNSTSIGTDFISVPYNINSSTVTVEVVVSFNPTSFWASIWANESYSAGRGYLAYLGGSTTIGYGRPSNEIAETITAGNSIRHLVFVINGTQQSLYLNGAQVGTTDTVTAQTLFATNNLYFGSRHTNPGTGHADKLNSSVSANQPVFYQMRVYNRGLTVAEIRQNYDTIKGTYSI